MVIVVPEVVLVELVPLVLLLPLLLLVPILVKTELELTPTVVPLLPDVCT